MEPQDCGIGVNDVGEGSPIHRQGGLALRPSRQGSAFSPPSPSAKEADSYPNDQTKTDSNHIAAEHNAYSYACRDADTYSS